MFFGRPHQCFPSVCGTNFSMGFPFVVLAAFALSKGSPRLAETLHRHRVFSPIIAEWRANGAIAPRSKVFALGIMG